MKLLQLVVAVSCLSCIGFVIITTLLMGADPFSPYSTYSMPIHYGLQLVLMVLGIVFVLEAAAHWGVSTEERTTLQNLGSSLLLLNIVLYVITLVYVLLVYMNCESGLFCSAGSPLLSRLPEGGFLAVVGYIMLFWPLVLLCTMSGSILMFKGRKKSANTHQSS